MGLACLGIARTGTPDEQVDAARFVMFAGVDPSRDGTLLKSDGTRIRARHKHQTLTDLEDLERGARRNRLRCHRLSRFQEIPSHLEAGRPVALAGNPLQEGAHGRRTGVEYEGGHFVLVVGYDPVARTYLVNDPIAPAPLQVTPEEMEAFCGYRVFGKWLGTTLSREPGANLCSSAGAGPGDAGHCPPRE